MSYCIIPNIKALNLKENLQIQLGEIPKIQISHSLYEYLSKSKLSIENYLPKWDNYKKITNPYEYVHTPISNQKNSVSTIRPLSRSFFKMIEMINSYRLLENYENGSIKTFHLAEGPGGFIEAVCYVREKNNYKEQDHYHGMTLISKENHVPGWKRARDFIEKNNIIIESGKDKTGDLLKEENLEYCFEKYKNSMNLITGDGGFDFSISFNDQEVLATRLIFAQIIFGLVMQKKGGSLVIKFFDIYTKPTIELLMILSNYYSSCFIYKPYTSRVANSEKYIICKNFLIDDSTEIYNLFKPILKKMYINKDLAIQSFLKIPINLGFKSKIEDMNSILGQYQIDNIRSTISLIIQSNKEKIENQKKINIQKCLNWCMKNNIPFHPEFNTKSNQFKPIINYEK